MRKIGKGGQGCTTTLQRRIHASPSGSLPYHTIQRFEFNYFRPSTENRESETNVYHMKGWSTTNSSGWTYAIIYWFVATISSYLILLWSLIRSGPCTIVGSKVNMWSMFLNTLETRVVATEGVVDVVHDRFSWWNCCHVLCETGDIPWQLCTRRTIKSSSRS